VEEARVEVILEAMGIGKVFEVDGLFKRN